MLPDGGLDCATLPLDAVLGSLSLDGGARVITSGALPAGTSAFGLHNGVLYTVTTDRSLRTLGTLPSLSLGAPIVNVLAPADRDAGTFLSGFVASNGQQLLTGYTKSGAGFPGFVALVQPDDAGVEYVPAGGNYTAAGLSTGAFLINGLSLGTATGQGVFALRPGVPLGTTLLTTFPDPYAGSGYTAVTANGVLIVGNSVPPSFSNIVRALPPSTYLGPVAAGTAFTYGAADAPVVAEGGDFATVTVFGDDVIVVRGGFDANFNAFTNRVERVPLTLSGSGTQTVSVGTPRTLLQNAARCTRVTFALGAGNDLYLGLNDRQGRRLIKLAP